MGSEYLTRSDRNLYTVGRPFALVLVFVLVGPALVARRRVVLAVLEDEDESADPAMVPITYGYAAVNAGD